MTANTWAIIELVSLIALILSAFSYPAVKHDSFVREVVSWILITSFIGFLTSSIAIIRLTPGVS